MVMTGMMRIDDRKGNSMIFIGITGGVGAVIEIGRAHV